MSRTVLSLCVQADKIAVQLYQNLAARLDDSSLQEFFGSMAKDGLSRISYWKDLEDSAERGFLPEIFDESLQVEEELKMVVRQLQELLGAVSTAVSREQALYLTYKLEFLLLHPAFETLFLFAKLVRQKNDYSEEYKEHIHKIVDGLQRYGKPSPEMELVGESLIRLWQENKKLSAQVVTDELTGILNRRGFFKTILPLSYLAQRAGNSVAVFMIDIDNFKKVNDQHGHLKGDKVLRTVAQAIAQAIRTSDVLGRFGGEEFIVFLPEVDKSFIFSLADKIRIAIKATSVDAIKVTASIGAKAGSFDINIENEIDSLIGQADSNLYQAKLAGKDQVFFS